MPQFKQNQDGSIGLQGVDLDNGGFIAINIPYDAASVDKVQFVATRAYVVHGITGRLLSQVQTDQR